MILCNLKLENFKRYKAYKIEFGDGLVGIIGKNGSGKSTIFEAILLALYGELKQRGWKENIRNSIVTTKDVVSIELIFEFEAKEYKVIREFRGKALSANAKLYKNGVLEVSGAREVTAAIISLTKMSKDAFIHTLFASQKELTSLSTLKNEDRKKMIRKLLGLEKIDFIEKLLLEKSTDLRREIKASAEYLLSDEDIKKNSELKDSHIIQKELIDKDIVLKSKELDKVRLEESAIQKELKLIQTTKDNKQKLFSELELIQNSINSNIQQQTKLSQEVDDLKLKKNELKSLEPIKKQYLELIELLKDQDKQKEYHLKKDGLQKEQIQLRDQYAKTKNDISILEKQCILYDNLIMNSNQLKQTISSLQDNITAKSTIETKIRAKIAGEQKLIDDTNKKILKIQNLGKGSNCPTCTRPLLEEYDNVINSLNTIAQNTHNTNINKFSDELKECEQQSQELKLQKESKDKEYLTLSNQIVIIQSKKKDLALAQEHFKTVEQKGLKNKQELEALDQYSYDESKHKDMQSNQYELKPKYEYVLQLETTVKRVGIIEVDLQTIKINIETQNKQYNDKECDWKTIDYDEVTHKTKQKLYDDTAKLKDEKTKVLGDIKVKVAQIVGELKSIQNTLDNNDIQLKRVQTKKDDLLDYDKIKVSLGEFKTKINSKVAPRISSIASEMYATITKGKYQHIEVSNDFDFYIYDDGKKYPIERFSGGEIDLANLVLRIAISKTLAELNGANSVGFLAFDEVFGSQDETRRMEILEAFHTIKEQYRQIFLISHEMEIKEMFEMVVVL